MLQVLNAARKAKLRVFYALHHRYRPGDYETGAHSKGGLDAKELRMRHLGRRDPIRVFATAGRNRRWREMHAALDVNLPNHASAIVTTNDIVEAISSL